MYQISLTLRKVLSKEYSCKVVFIGSLKQWKQAALAATSIDVHSSLYQLAQGPIRSEYIECSHMLTFEYATVVSKAQTSAQMEQNLNIPH